MSRDGIRAGILRFAGTALVLALLLAACGGTTPTPPPSTLTPQPPSSAAAPVGPAGSEVPGSPIAGIVTAVDAPASGQVQGFTLQAASGETLQFVLGSLDASSDFQADGLADHMASAAQIFVYFREENGQLVVYQLMDAG